MVTTLQFVATAAFLIWCLACSVADVLNAGNADGLVSRERSQEARPGSRQSQ